MTTLQALALGLLQGATELFPVSSLGHAVVVPSLLHWGVQQSDPSFVPYLVLLHLGTAFALLVLYRAQWVRIVRGFVTASVRGRITTADERLAMLLVVGTVPGGVIGFLLEHPLKALFASPRVAATFLIVNGAMLFSAELLRRRQERRSPVGEDAARREERFHSVEQLSFRAAVAVGACQAVALLPGISRSGITMAGGLVAGLRHEEAARFSFLLATPIIGAAGLLEVPSLVGSSVPLGTYALGAVLAGGAAYLSARFLLRWFHDGRLDPYAGYCVALGAIALVLLR